MIDLHCHSTFSDGAHSPDELIEKAIQANVNILALTDHDTVEGLPELHEAAKLRSSPIQIINGIELSTRWKKYDIHILGLNLDPENFYLRELISMQHERRKFRAVEIGRRLEAFGIENAYLKAMAIAGHDNVTRPHFAQLLINEGVTNNLQAGFTRLLGRGKKAYVPTSWAMFPEAISAIEHAGGQAVLAHPLKYGLTRTKLRELIVAFKEAGGAGMEVVSGECTNLQINELAALCRHYGLLASSGSDFHNENASRTGLGRQRALPLNCMPIWHRWTS